MSQTVNLNFISTKLAEHSIGKPILFQQSHPSCVATIFLQQFLWRSENTLFASFVFPGFHCPIKLFEHGLFSLLDLQKLLKMAA